MKLVKVKKETPDTSTLTFEGKRKDYKAGQFFIIEFMRREKIPKRSYSVSSSPARKGLLELTVKAMPEGYVSKLLVEAKVGEEFILDGPWGHFAFDEATMPEIVMIGAGSGIAPFRAICQYIMDKGLGTKATLVYSSRTFKDIICRAELLDFEKKIKGLKLIITLSREKRKGFHSGRIDDAMIKEITSKSPAADYFICGPPAMVSDIEKMLLAHGIQPEKIKLEKYG